MLFSLAFFDSPGRANHCARRACRSEPGMPASLDGVLNPHSQEEPCAGVRKFPDTQDALLVGAIRSTCDR